ncbi:homoserine O-acetyltransferase [Bacillus tianshenii]|uniref:Homoserine O-acetyltransferase n=1 Tax=Sutcliffiella tianshenii TaxID=1463404 RepID=A0ABS2P5R7_9BACI|nr:homoserine O-acetyltransferase [Bacillus tianshenii]MBM7622263.1 homoserine O-acetyltransferase [Bacillus tianshenii]
MTDCEFKAITGSVRIDRLELVNGEVLDKVEIAYEQVGNKNGELIIVCHALTGNQFAKGTETEKGWWHSFIGPESYIDTNDYQVITMNVLGGCNGSTGPTSLNPDTGERYGRDFPSVTVRDMVHAQYLALRMLGYEKAKAVIGGSLGGMQVLEWGILYPDYADILIPMAVTPYFTDYALAFNCIGRRAIMTDPLWNNGNYRENEMLNGLEIARMVGLVTYRSAGLFNHRFNRERKHTEDSVTEYQVDSYMKYQGEKFTRRFDANCYLSLLEAMDQFDIGWDRGGWRQALSQIKSSVCMIGFSKDLLYPTSMIRETVEELKAHGKSASYVEVETEFGHDGFLVEFDKWGFEVKRLLEKKERREVTHV